MRSTPKRVPFCGRRRSMRTPSPASKARRRSFWDICTWPWARELESARDAAYPCCTFRGSVAALDLVSGRLEWKTYLVSEEPQPVHAEAGGAPRFAPSGVPAVAPPTVDAARSLLYVSTGDSYGGGAQPFADAVVALDLADGKVRWAKPLEAPQADRSRNRHAAVLRTLSSGREMVLVGQRSGSVYSLDPERIGEVFVAARGGRPGGGCPRAGRGRRPSQSLRRALGPRCRAAQCLGQLDCHRHQDREPALADSVSDTGLQLGREARLHACPDTGGDGDSGRRLFRIDGRSPARVFHHRWQDSLGLRHRQGFSHR